MVKSSSEVGCKLANGSMRLCNADHEPSRVTVRSDSGRREQDKLVPYAMRCRCGIRTKSAPSRESVVYGVG